MSNSNTSKKSVGARLKALREGKRLSQRDLGDRLELKDKHSQTKISQIEGGERKASIDFLIQASRFFKKSIDFLATGEELSPGTKSDFFPIPRNASAVEGLSSLIEAGLHITNLDRELTKALEGKG